MITINVEAVMGVKLHFLDQKGLEYANAITEWAFTWTCTIQTYKKNLSCSYANTLYKRTFNLTYSNDFLFSFTKVGKKSQECSNIIHTFNNHSLKKKSKFG